MNQYDVEELKRRHEKRQRMSREERQLMALEDIADSLVGLVSALERIGDNVA